MNCDQVFDILTRGPFPTGTSCDAGVEAHLASCGECRRLAEALRPALELFQEAVAPEESRDLPGYWCAVTSESAQGVASFTRPLERRRVERLASTPRNLFRGWSPVTAWRMAAMLAVGALLGTLAGSRGVFDGRWKFPPPNDPPSAMTTPADDERPHLSISEHSELAALPAACSRHRPGNGPRYTLRGDRLLAQADLANLNCCSECHNANSEAVPATATIQVSRQCQLCHNEHSSH